MEAKTKIQKQVVALSKKLTPITQKQIDWGYDHCFDHIGRVSKKGITCLDCLHTWDAKCVLGMKLLGCTCPNCGRKLKVQETRKRVFKDSAYYGITTTYKGFQLFRLMFIEVKFKTNELPDYSCHEVVQRWISPDGKQVILSVPRYSNFNYYDIWGWYEPMEVRSSNHMAYSILPYKTYPAVKYIPQIKRNGFNGDFHDMKPFDFYSLILSSTQAETFLKSGELEWFKYTARNQKQVHKCWPAIKIALRHKCKIKDRRHWLDYIELLVYFKKDLHNPKVVFPADLHKEHDRLVAKKRVIQRKEELEKNKQKAIEQEERYKKSKGRFFGVHFTDGLINVRVLSSVQEVVEEGDAMHHCVYTNNYHQRKDSLLLSATADGNRVETVEISLSEFKVMQSRGRYNQNSEYHDQILELVNRNMNLIRKRAKKKVTTSNYQSL